MMRPSLLLDFANTRRLDPRITYTRASTATYFDRYGVLKTAAINEPRFDHDPVTGDCKGLLIEESRTNLVVYSDNDPGWQGLGTTPPTVNSNNWVEDGLICTKTTFPIISGGGYAVCRAQGTTGITVVSGGTYIHSSWLKLSRPLTGSESFKVYVTGAYSLSLIDINASNSSPLTSWGRITSSSGTSGLNGSDYFVIFAMRLDSPLTVYSARRQVELGSYASSFIPTNGSAVTRSADTALMTGTNFSSWFNASEGTFVTSFVSAPGNGAQPAFAATDGTVSNRIAYFPDTSSGSGTGYDNSAAVISVGGTGVYYVTTEATVMRAAKYAAALAYKVGDAMAASKGVLSTAGTPASLPAVNQLTIGGQLAGQSTINGHIARLAYYPRRLANSYLQALTL